MTNKITLLLNGCSVHETTTDGKDAYALLTEFDGVRDAIEKSCEFFGKTLTADNFHIIQYSQLFAFDHWWIQKERLSQAEESTDMREPDTSA